MQEKVECLTHHNQLRVFANLKYSGMGKCVLPIKGTNVPFAAVRERYVV